MLHITIHITSIRTQKSTFSTCLPVDVLDTVIVDKVCTVSTQAFYNVIFSFLLVLHWNPPFSLVGSCFAITSLKNKFI